MALMVLGQMWLQHSKKVFFLNYEEAFQKQLKLNDIWYDEEGYKTFGSIEEACVAINNDVGDPPFDAYRIEPVKIIE